MVKFDRIAYGYYKPGMGGPGFRSAGRAIGWIGTPSWSGVAPRIWEGVTPVWDMWPTVGPTSSSNRLSNQTIYCPHSLLPDLPRSPHHYNSTFHRARIRQIEKHGVRCCKNMIRSRLYEILCSNIFMKFLIRTIQETNKKEAIIKEEKTWDQTGWGHFTHYPGRYVDATMKHRYWTCKIFASLWFV